MKIYLMNFFATLLLSNCLAFGAKLAGAQPTYWTEVLCVGFAFFYASIMHFEPRIKQ